jgi:uncharacterized protein (TIGR03089 family)
MDDTASLTVVGAFSTVMATDPTRPFITFYDDATGERTELSGATLGNWVAKTANLLVDGLGLGSDPDDAAAVALPAHWQTAAILLGCWSVGLPVTLPPDEAGGQPDPMSVGFVSQDLLDRVRADETYALALAPLALPFRPGPPAGTLDYSVEVRAFGDHFTPRPVPPTRLALGALTHAELVAAARSRGIPAGSRVLIDGDAHPDPIDWLVAPLVAGASVVLCRNLDPAALEPRLTTERATLPR